jgi:NitT/TauT family transport system ATP-binding protein
MVGDPNRLDSSRLQPMNLEERPAIKIADLSLSFGPNLLVLDKVSLSAKPGEFVSIVGPSGCGKTTILNLLAGLIQVPYAGSISILDRPPQLGSQDVAYMLARDCMIPWRDAIGNASFGLQIRGTPKHERLARASALLKQVGLSGFEHALPKQLSHGMRQRCALARTFALDSSVLLMDEPFGALDAQTKLQLEDVLVDLWQAERRTVIFITHDIGEAIALSDRVIVMSGRPGRIISDTIIPLPRPRSVRELQKDPLFHEIYAHVWGMLEDGWRGDNVAKS